MGEVWTGCGSADSGDSSCDTGFFELAIADHRPRLLSGQESEGGLAVASSLFGVSYRRQNFASGHFDIALLRVGAQLIVLLGGPLSDNAETSLFEGVDFYLSRGG